MPRHKQQNKVLSLIFNVVIYESFFNLLIIIMRQTCYCAIASLPTPWLLTIKYIPQKNIYALKSRAFIKLKTRNL